MIEEVNGRWTCDKCGYEWSACISDDKVPEVCACEGDKKIILTEEQKKAYIEGNQCICPVCKCDDIEGSSVNIDSGGAWQSVSCNNCNREWVDIYKLVDVEMR